MKRKALTILLTGVLCVGLLSACGTSQSNSKSEETTTATESSEIETDTSTEELETEETKETESTEAETETPKTEESQTPAEETASTEKESTAAQAESKSEPHKHSYTSSITTQASCSQNGVKTFTCSCGDSYTESIPKTDHSWNGGEYISNGTCSAEAVKRFTCNSCGATYDKGTGEYGNHNFVEQQQTIHHEGSGHYETVRYIKCSSCGEVFYDASSAKAHKEETMHDFGYYEDEQWIVDSESWDETITIYTCNICGSTK